MNGNSQSRIPEIVKQCESSLLSEWVSEQLTASSLRSDLLDEAGLRNQCRNFLSVLQKTLQNGQTDNINTPEWNEMQSVLDEITRSRLQAGFSPAETATFIFSFKQPLFSCIRKQLKNDPETVFEETWKANLLLDKLGLLATEMYQRSREAIIERQQQEMLELSTPVVKLWDGILALPLIGALDSTRTQIVMEALLNKIIETESSIAIIDITGVPTVDTLTAQHLLKTVSAARLMGAECIISGIRPQIAQTVVHLGLDLSQVTTKSSLADAFKVALKELGLGVAHTDPRS